jgi:hypothetical protein
LAWLCNQANIQELTISRLSVCTPDMHRRHSDLCWRESSGEWM